MNNIEWQYLCLCCPLVWIGAMLFFIAPFIRSSEISENERERES